MARRRQTSKKSIGKTARRGSPASSLHRYTKKTNQIKKSPSSGYATPSARQSVPRQRYRRLTQTRNAAPLSSPTSQLSPATFYSGGVLKTVSPELHRAVTCAKRKIRREVMFASGHGGKKVRRPTYNLQSNVRC